MIRVSSLMIAAAAAIGLSAANSLAQPEDAPRRDDRREARPAPRDDRGPGPREVAPPRRDDRQPERDSQSGNDRRGREGDFNFEKLPPEMRERITNHLRDLPPEQRAEAKARIRDRLMQQQRDDRRPERDDRRGAARPGPQGPRGGEQFRGERENAPHRAPHGAQRGDGGHRGGDARRGEGIPPEMRERIRNHMRDLPPERREQARERIREHMKQRMHDQRGGGQQQFRGGPQGPRGPQQFQGPRGGFGPGAGGPPPFARERFQQRGQFGPRGGFGPGPMMPHRGPGGPRRF
jgi:hypothetical protein